MKVHLICGVKTNIVTAVEIRDRHAADTKSLPDLLDMTAEDFKLREISADKAYSATPTTTSRSATARHRSSPSANHLRSKAQTAMVNEVLCKIICHNICLLVQEAVEATLPLKL